MHVPMVPCPLNPVKFKLAHCPNVDSLIIYLFLMYLQIYSETVGFGLAFLTLPEAVA